MQSSDNMNQEVWKVINNEINTTTILTIIQLNENNFIIIKPTTISNLFNHYYTHLPEKKTS